MVFGGPTTRATRPGDEDTHFGATMFVSIVILMVMAIGLNYLIGVVERWVAPWQAEIAGREE